jgi:hypothetical protein
MKGIPNEVLYFLRIKHLTSAEIKIFSDFSKMLNPQNEISALTDLGHLIVEGLKKIDNGLKVGEIMKLCS